MIDRAMAARGNRALLLIDLGVPRNVAADVGDIYNTYLYNIDDLTEIVEQNKKAREAEIPRAEAIIDEQIEKFLHWQAGVAAGAVLGDLRNKLAAEREAFVQERLASMPQSFRAGSRAGGRHAAGIPRSRGARLPPNACAEFRNCAANFRILKRSAICSAWTGRSLEAAANRHAGQRARSLAGAEHRAELCASRRAMSRKS